MMRSLTIDTLATKMAELGLPGGWWYPDAEREACRARTLRGCRDADLWVFAYGSLMWDPGLHFCEVRRAHLPGHQRRFILKDIYGGRGTPDRPGLMAALDTAPDSAGCDGLLFRIAQADIEQETEVLWRREMIGPAYLATFVEARVDDAPVTALTFVADHAAELIDATLDRDAALACFTTGAGFMGSSLDYLRNVDDKLHVLGVADRGVAELRRAAEARLAAQAG